MDILRKMFKENEEMNKKDSEAMTKDEFRKPQWFEESETDDELFDDDRKFAFQIFTNPMELQKHFERQMQQVLEAVSEYEENETKLDKDLKEEYMKPGFEEYIKEFEKQKKMFDTDLDGEIYADQLHSLMQRFTPDNNSSIIPRNDNKSGKMLSPKKKLSDEEIIMGKIHGTIVEEDNSPVVRRNEMAQIIPRNGAPFNGVFEGTYQGPKMFRQSVMTKTIRKPDGTYETTRITQDSEGNKATTTTRTVNGKTETVTTYNGENSADSVGHQTSLLKKFEESSPPSLFSSNRNISVTKEGYAVPRNLW